MGAACLDFATLTERSRLRKVLRMVGGIESVAAPTPEDYPGGRNAQLIGLPCGSDGCAMTPSGVRGVLKDAISLYFVDPPLANAFVARWYAGSKAEAAGGVFQVREDEPAPRPPRP